MKRNANSRSKRLSAVLAPHPSPLPPGEGASIWRCGGCRDGIGRASSSTLREVFLAPVPPAFSRFVSRVLLEIPDNGSTVRSPGANVVVMRAQSAITDEVLVV